MTQDQILELLIDATNNDKQAMLYALQDGQTLSSLGITDNDTEAVECAYAVINQSLNDKYAWLN